MMVVAPPPPPSLVLSLTVLSLWTGASLVRIILIQRASASRMNALALQEPEPLRAGPHTRTLPFFHVTYLNCERRRGKT